MLLTHTPTCFHHPALHSVSQHLVWVSTVDLVQKERRWHHLFLWVVLIRHFLVVACVSWIWCIFSHFRLRLTIIQIIPTRFWCLFLHSGWFLWRYSPCSKFPLGFHDCRMLWLVVDEWSFFIEFILIWLDNFLSLFFLAISYPNPWLFLLRWLDYNYCEFYFTRVEVRTPTLP